MITVHKIKKAYQHGLISFHTNITQYGSEIICTIGDVSFVFLDQTLCHKYLLNSNNLTTLCKKIKKNIQALKTYRPEKYCRIKSCLSVKF